MGQAARHDEDAERPVDPSKPKVAALQDENRQRKGNREIGQRYQRVGHDMQPDQLGLPQQANAVGREHRRVQDTFKEIYHRSRLQPAADSYFERMVRDSRR